MLSACQQGFRHILIVSIEMAALKLEVSYDCKFIIVLREHYDFQENIYHQKCTDSFVKILMTEEKQKVNIRGVHEPARFFHIPISLLKILCQ